MVQDECDVLVCSRYELKRYSLKIDPVYKNDSGRYACLAKNDLGHAWLNFTITVTGTTNTNNVFTLIYQTSVSSFRLHLHSCSVFTDYFSGPGRAIGLVRLCVRPDSNFWSRRGSLRRYIGQVRKSRHRWKFTVRKILPVVGATSSKGFLAAWITEIKTKSV